MEDLRENVDIYKKSLLVNYKKLKFSGISKKFDIYNPSKAFEFKGKKYIFGRVEKRRDWANSKVVLFKKNERGVWRRTWIFKPLKLEDPFITKIYGKFVFGGVFVRKSAGKIGFKTIFYKGDSPFSLKKFAEGPWDMKDIRLIELESGKIGIFTRPQGRRYGLGKIGFTTIDSLDELNEEVINGAKLIRFPFKKGEWGGVNDVLLLKKDILGVFGHLAYSKDDGRKFYYPISFKFDIKMRKIISLKLLFTRNDLPFGLPKNRFLYNVVFPGGIFLDKNQAQVYVGVGDSESYKIEIKNPFK